MQSDKSITEKHKDGNELRVYRNGKAIAKLRRPSPNPRQVRMFTFPFASFVTLFVFPFVALHSRSSALACFIASARKICRVDFHYEIFITYFQPQQREVDAPLWVCVFVCFCRGSKYFKSFLCVADAVSLVNVFLSVRCCAVINNCSEWFWREKPHGIMWRVKTFGIL